MVETCVEFLYNKQVTGKTLRRSQSYNMHVSSGSRVYFLFLLYTRIMRLSPWWNV